MIVRTPDSSRGRHVRGGGRLGYTLIEVLIVVTILGIAGAMLVPVMGQTAVLRVQGAVRTIVSDITIAQSDALAYQRGRAIVFNYPADQSYVTCEVNGTTIDPDLDRLSLTNLLQEDFGDSRITAVNFGGGSTLIFDEIGAPVAAPGSNTPAPTGIISVEGAGQRFDIAIEGYTGRVTVTRVGG